MRLLLIAPPGGGKGTQGARLSELLGVTHVSTGDMLRAEVAAGSALGIRVAGYLRRGQLAPDELILGALMPSLVAAVGRGGFILDGFPRTIEQARAADDRGQGVGIALDAVVYLRVADAELERRLLARAAAEERNDDTPEVIARRLRLFVEQTAPLLDFYDDRGLLVSVDGDRPVGEVTDDVLRRLQQEVR